MSKLFADLVKDDFDHGEDAFPVENTNLTGHPATESRLCAIQAIYQHLLVGDSLSEIHSQFKPQLRRRKTDTRVFEAIVPTVAENILKFEENIGTNLTSGWTLERLSLVERAILLAGIGELVARVDTPQKIIINEFLNISKGFLEQKKIPFINGILDKAASTFRANEK